MNVIVDSCIWIDYFAGKPNQHLDQLLQDGQVTTTPVIISELVSGCEPKTQRQLISFMKDLALTDASLEHWITVGKLRHNLQRRGLSVSTPDTHIVQSCLDVNASLMTHDKIFTKLAHFAGIKILTK